MQLNYTENIATAQLPPSARVAPRYGWEAGKRPRHSVRYSPITVGTAAALLASHRFQSERPAAPFLLNVTTAPRSLPMRPRAELLGGSMCASNAVDILEGLFCCLRASLPDARCAPRQRMRSLKGTSTAGQFINGLEPDRKPVRKVGETHVKEGLCEWY